MLGNLSLLSPLGGARPSLRMNFSFFFCNFPSVVPWRCPGHMAEAGLLGGSIGPPGKAVRRVGLLGLLALAAVLAAGAAVLLVARNRQRDDALLGAGAASAPTASLVAGALPPCMDAWEQAHGTPCVPAPPGSVAPHAAEKTLHAHQGLTADGRPAWGGTMEFQQPYVPPKNLYLFWGTHSQKYLMCLDVFLCTRAPTFQEFYAQASAPPRSSYLNNNVPMSIIFSYVHTQARAHSRGTTLSDKRRLRRHFLFYSRKSVPE